MHALIRCRATALLATLLAAPMVVGRSVAQEPTAEQFIAPDVQRLLALDSRDAAFTRILKRGKYRGPGTYTEDPEGLKVRHVVVCPQPSGAPLFAVFADSSERLEAQGIRIIGPSTAHHFPRGHLILIASDGAVVRCYMSNNRVDGTIADINADGVIERVESMRYLISEEDNLSLSELYVLPITEAMEPTLRIAFDANEPRDRSTWRVVPADGGSPARIELGPKDPDTGELREVIATWTWNQELSVWTGPGGGPDQEFMRLPPEGYEPLKEFALRHRRKSKDR